MPCEQNNGDECEHGGRHSHHFRGHSHRLNRYRYIYISVADPGCLSRIPDPTFFHPGPLIPYLNFFHPGSRIHIKDFEYFNPKNCFLSSRKYDPVSSFRIRILICLPIPDPGSRGKKKAPDPGSATLIIYIQKVADLVLDLHGSEFLGKVFLFYFNFGTMSFNF